MDNHIYLRDVTSLEYDPSLCNGCQMCVEVCPHNVFRMTDKRAEIIHKDKCMECGACTFTCPSGVPIVHLIRAAKSAIRQQKQKEQGS